MKKKIFTALTALIFVFTAFGCSAADVVPSFDTTKPWAESRYEYCEYSVEKIYVGGDEDVVVASGTYTSTTEVGTTTTTLKNSFRLNYNAVPEAVTFDSLGRNCINVNLSDYYDAEVTFNNDGLAPVSSSKNFTVAQRPLCDGADGNVAALPERIDTPADGVNYRYELDSQVKYADPRGYKYTVNYSDNTAHFETDEAETTKESRDGKTVYLRDYSTVTKDFEVAANTRYDNEQLAHVVRALSSTKKKGSATFYLSNIYDSYINDKYVRYTMSSSCADKTTELEANIDPAKFTLTDTEAELVKTDNGKYSVPCVKASVTISSSTPGPEIVLYLTDPSVTITRNNEHKFKTNKVVLQMVYTEYSPKNVKMAYQTVYTLKDYRTERTSVSA